MLHADKQTDGQTHMIRLTVAFGNFAFEQQRHILEYTAKVNLKALIIIIIIYFKKFTQCSIIIVNSKQRDKNLCSRPNLPWTACGDDSAPLKKLITKVNKQKQDSQCTYNITLTLVRATIVVVEKQ